MILFLLRNNKLHKIINTALKEKRYLLNEIESKTLVKSYKIPVVVTKLATSAKEARDIASKLKFPLAMKIVSNDISHKSDVGGVVLGVSSLKEVDNNYKSMMRAVKKANKHALIQGVAVQPMVDDGIELVVGVTTDQQFGPVLMFGLGGVFVEFMKDVSFKLIPLRKIDAKNILSEIKSKEILLGARGFPKIDLIKLQELILNVSNFVQDNPEIEEVDLNPVIANSKEMLAVDARIVLKQQVAK